MRCQVYCCRVSAGQCARRCCFGRRLALFLACAPRCTAILQWRLICSVEDEERRLCVSHERTAQAAAEAALSLHSRTARCLPAASTWTSGQKAVARLSTSEKQSHCSIMQDQRQICCVLRSHVLLDCMQRSELRKQLLRFIYAF